MSASVVSDRIRAFEIEAINSPDAITSGGDVTTPQLSPRNSIRWSTPVRVTIGSPNSRINRAQSAHPSKRIALSSNVSKEETNDTFAGRATTTTHRGVAALHHKSSFQKVMDDIHFATQIKRGDLTADKATIVNKVFELQRAA